MRFSPNDSGWVSTYPGPSVPRYGGGRFDFGVVVPDPGAVHRLAPEPLVTGVQIARGFVARPVRPGQGLHASGALAPDGLVDPQRLGACCAVRLRHDGGEGDAIL